MVLYSFLRIERVIAKSSRGRFGDMSKRMPVILPSGQERAYLESLDEAKRLLKPYPERGMGSYEVSSLVNSAKNEGPSVQKPKKSLQDYF
ncbi:MAG: SOS response-associated peptidase family protein [Candidatus Micrarchaeota archaeon]